MKIAYFKILVHQRFMETFNKAIIIIKIKINLHTQVVIQCNNSKISKHLQIWPVTHYANNTLYHHHIFDNILFKISLVKLAKFQINIITFGIKHQQDIIHRHFIEKTEIILKIETKNKNKCKIFTSKYLDIPIQVSSIFLRNFKARISIEFVLIHARQKNQWRHHNWKCKPKN